MRQNHSSAAISVQAQLVESDGLRTPRNSVIGILVGVSVGFVLLNLLDQIDKLVVLVTDDLKKRNKLRQSY
jgi:hypothetical protein